MKWPGGQQTVLQKKRRTRHERVQCQDWFFNWGLRNYLTTEPRIANKRQPRFGTNPAKNRSDGGLERRRIKVPNASLEESWRVHCSKPLRVPGRHGHGAHGAEFRCRSGVETCTNPFAGPFSAAFSEIPAFSSSFLCISNLIHESRLINWGDSTAASREAGAKS